MDPPLPLPHISLVATSRHPSTTAIATLPPPLLPRRRSLQQLPPSLKLPVLCQSVRPEVALTTPAPSLLLKENLIRSPKSEVALAKVIATIGIAPQQQIPAHLQTTPALHPPSLDKLSRPQLPFPEPVPMTLPPPFPVITSTKVPPPISHYTRLESVGQQHPPHPTSILAITKYPTQTLKVPLIMAGPVTPSAPVLTISSLRSLPTKPPQLRTMRRIKTRMTTRKFTNHSRTV